MKRHLNAIVLVSGIALLCVALGIIMTQTFLRKPLGSTQRPLSTEIAPAP